MRRARVVGTWPPLIVALLLLVACAALAWPGIAAYDATTQFAQAITGRYDDWHPPIMARLWSLFLKAGAWGTAPMLLLQLVLLWSGLAMLAVALRRARAPIAGWCVLAVGLLPPVLDWMVVVDKDCQMIGALACAIGLVALFRLAKRPLPWWAVIVVAVLLAYAMLLRANSVFAVMPLALMWGGWLGLRRWWARIGLLLGAMLAVIGISGPINHGLLGADRSGVQYTLPIFDLAGISDRAHLAAMPGLSDADWAKAEQLHCTTPFYWDPFADPARCGPMGNGLVSDDNGPPPLFHNWIAAIIAHPLAYAEHRAAHLNSTLRIVTPPDEHSAAAPFQTPENLYNVGAKASGATVALSRVAGAIEETPIGVPAVWLVATLAIGWVLLATPRQPARTLALSLAVSAMLMTASFAVVSIASDLRYHLWLILSTALAAVLLGGCRRVPRGRLAIAAGAVVVACVASVLLRAGAPPMRY
ncbi:hypothetical protein HZF05_18960 [Sphingomonas sp. CGMCC 1.13654]|uniref:Glycosyltransferase RgtA/B/C/D-like domain-containing protein n=1 Tax=Sphingomonas chungangi TaxID=2683589 RepID=A0A838LFF5_9SPHN|nr:hypothetical protein [Sphingomonas chungangi]MBA2936168.1 hypothetical protein [Sphingomonas chungangi]MVW55554.1 hypothetical protein [Sphingomonas chungangi]